MKWTASLVVVVAISWFSAWLSIARSDGLESTRFDRKECQRFRKLLQRHFSESRSLQEESERLGVAALATFFIPVVPYPLAIMSIVRSRQAETRSLLELRSMGVTDINWEYINSQCIILDHGGDLSSMEPIGRRTKVADLGSSGVAYASAGISLIYTTALHVLLFCYFCVDVEIVGR